MRIIPLAMLIGAVVALVSPATAAAVNAPVLNSVGHVNRHPEARWTLPPYVQASVVEVARSAETASDGSFFTENVVVFDIAGETDTHWLYASQLGPGRYYVHVKGWDDSCFHTNFETECGPAWSNVLPLTIPNAPPRIASVKVTPSYGWQMSASVRVCDDGRAPITFVVTERLTKTRPFVTARKTLRKSHLGGCDVHYLSWRLSSNLRQRMRYGHRLTVTIAARDSAGNTSNRVSRSWDILD